MCGRDGVGWEDAGEGMGEKRQRAQSSRSKIGALKWSWLRRGFGGHQSKSHIIFVESVCDDEDIIEHNIKVPLSIRFQHPMLGSDRTSRCRRAV